MAEQREDGSDGSAKKGEDRPEADQEHKDGADDKGGDNQDDDKKDEDQGPPVYKRPIFWIIAIVVLAILIIGGLLYWLHARKYVSSDDAFVDTHIVRVAAETSGRLVSVVDLDNRHVQQGQLLAIIEPEAPEAQLAEAQAGVSQAEAAIEQAKAKLLSARATAQQAAENAIAPAANAEHAASDYQRYARLRALDAAAAAATQVEKARTDSEAQLGQARAAQKQVAMAQADVVAAAKDVDSARAQRDAALARVKQAQVTNGHLRISAPQAGQVVNRQVAVGSYVAPGQQLLAIVPDRMWVTANFKETQLTHMKVGQAVDIRVDAFPSVKFRGHVDSFQHGAGQAFSILPPQNATGNYVKVVQRVPVRIEFDGTEWRNYPIGPGMSVVPTVQVRP